MSTNIRVDVTLQRLQQQLLQSIEQNRTEKAEREQQSQQTTAARSVPQTPATAGQALPNALSSRDPRDATGVFREAPFNQRRPAAQRDTAGWGLWTADWLAPFRSASTGIPRPGGGTFSYTYIEAKDLQFLKSLQKDDPATEPTASLVFPQNAFVVSTNGGVLGNSSNHGNLPVITQAGEFAGEPYIGGNFYFTQAPVVSSANGVLFGVQRHSYGQINTPWTRSATTGVIPGNGTTYNYLYVFFRFDTGSGKLETRSTTASLTYDTSTGPADLSPYVEGGSIWAEKYAENAYSGDPSLAVRELGYYGDYHVTGSTAKFLRYNPTGSNLFFNLTSLNSRLLWNTGAELKWLAFPISYENPEELKLELDACLAETPVRTYTAAPAFSKQADIDKYNVLSTAVKDSTLPTNGDQFWSPTGPFVYPLVPPP